jgi:hypothetical protein
MRAAVALLLLCAPGCNREALPPPGSDAGSVTLDGSALPDASPDVDALRAVGDPCTSSGQCADQLCITGAPFSGGYCTQHIAECPGPGDVPGPCPAGSACVNPGSAATGGDYCAKLCAADGDCRVAEGYKCCPWPRGGPGIAICETVCP